MQTTRHNKYFALIVLMFLLLNCVPLFALDTPPFSLPPKQELLKIRSAILYTEKGEVYFRLYPEEAPWHVANLKYLADKGFYKNLKFHKYVPNLAIQTGASGVKANSGPGYTLPAEFNNRKHDLGALSMVRKPNDLDFDHSRRSHGSQFRIILGRAPHMDGQYVVFGQVVKGIGVAERLRVGDRVLDLKVFVKEDEHSVIR
ncbi:MAG: peptidylprolyl isomerase [Bdellovibrionota bacterium]|jgi:cyclophilin family peptidyl-prolyl cis-trans isomerase